MVSPFDANGKVRLKFTTVLLLALLLCEELEKHCGGGNGGKAAKMRREKFSNCTFETLLRLSSRIEQGI